MRTIIHISDLHFGRTEASLETALWAAIRERSPDLVVVSGDITQRATAHQFYLARNFFRSLVCPIIAVPGNHDIPLYSVWRRLFKPFNFYKKYISEELEPRYEDEEMLIVGINTVRIFKAKEGRVNMKQIIQVKDALAATSPEKMKIVVSHHPFNIPIGYREKLLSRARHFWKSHRETGIDIILSGHTHDTLENYLGMEYKLFTPGPLLIQAGTAVSVRRRNEENSFNVLTFFQEHISLERYEYLRDRKIFAIKKTKRFVKREKIWTQDFD